MSVRRAVVTVVLVLAVTLVASVGPAAASCHMFTVSVQPSSVAEGGTVTITITRDGPVGESSVRVQTSHVTTNSADYTSIGQRVSFVQGELSKQLVLSTTEDSAAEPNEQLRVGLLNPQGCNGGPYDLGPDATVTIQNDDATTTTTRPTTTTTAPTTTSSSTTSSSTTSSSTSTTRPTTTSSTEDDGSTSEPTTTTVPPRTGEREEGGGSWMLPLVLGLVVAVAFGGAVYARRRIVADEGDVEE